MKKPSKEEQLIRCQESAKQRGGECLSACYLNPQTKLQWKCAKGHEWSAVPYSILNGTWCPECAGKNKTIVQMAAVAIQRGGKCLSTEYKGAHGHLLWQCEKNHTWEATPSNILRGKWCPECAGNTRLTLDDMQTIAEERGGKCLSTQYVNSITKLKWQCAAGHKWVAVPASIIAGRWCPTCSQGSSERICKDVFEQMFGLPFPKIRPKWLINDKGNFMELDGYCDEWGVAFEYHGEQHYEFTPFFHRQHDDLELRQQNDAKKRQLCREHGILLIEVPFDEPIQRLPFLIKDAVSSSGRTVKLADPASIKVATHVLPEFIHEMRAYS